MTLLALLRCAVLALLLVTSTGAETMTNEQALDYLRGQEGFRSHAYRDGRGWAIGFGHWMMKKPTKNTITQDEANDVLKDDFLKAEMAAARSVRNYDALPRTAQLVLTFVAFQVGASGLHSFRLLLSYVDAMRFHEAAKELRDSRLYDQSPDRTEGLACMLEACGD